ncbi:MAG: FG-GAP repeat protein [Bryobacteraceae bacterium]|nr:FG-GAP repeat protein [Bryobacteraceae bacterium]
MRLASYGYGEKLSPVGFPELVAKGNQIDFRRSWPPIEEWYVNEPAGLEQGFTLPSPPPAKFDGERLRLAMEVTGDLTAELAEGGQSVSLKHSNGDVILTYGELHAFDAQGRELPSQMLVRQGHVLLEVDDDQAVYPVTIDPTFTQQVNLRSSDGARNDNFGHAVAISGNVVVVGAPYDDVGTRADQGSAYVFLRSNGVWSQVAKLTATDGAAGDNFGSSVAIRWDTIVVGARYDDAGPNADLGSAYVFFRTGPAWANWTQQAKLVPSIAGSNDHFGTSVAIDAYTGNTVVVGAPDDDISFNNQGSAYVFVRSGTTWNQQQRLIASDGGTGAQFGYSVAVEAFTLGTIVVGAPSDDIDSKADQGSVYVFFRSNGAWIQQPKLVASDGEAGDAFGFSVATSMPGSRIVVGAPGDNIIANANQGSAYVFQRSTGFPYAFQAKLLAGDGAAGDSFGSSAAISGYEVVLGAPNDDTGLNVNQGSAYNFVCNGACVQSQKLGASNGATSDWFGNSVAVDPAATSPIVVGSPFKDLLSNSNQGSAYLFLR